MPAADGSEVSRSLQGSAAKHAPLSILVLSSYLPGVGGGELQTALQVRTLVRRGHRVRVIDLGTHPGAPKREVLDGAEVIRLPVPDIAGLAGLMIQIRLGLLLARLLRSTDIVHFNHIGAQLLATRLLCWMLRVPLIVVVWGSSRPGIGPFRRGFKWRLARRAARSAEAIVALGSETCRNLVGWGFPGDRLVLIPNGIDLDRFRPAGADEDLPTGAPSGRPRVVTVGRLVPAKGYDLLVQAWAGVFRRRPSAVLAIVGAGAERGRLEQLLEGAPFRSQVHLLGLRENVEQWLRWADLYVSSSRTEGMSNSVLEALGSGLPVLATRVGGAEDVIQDRLNGRLVASGSVAELEAALVELLGHPGELRAMGAAARSRAERELSIDAVVDQYESLYRRVRSRSRPRAGHSGA